MECDDSVVKLEQSMKKLRVLKVDQLKTILKEQNQPVGGRKEDLVLICHVLAERQKERTVTEVNCGNKENESIDGEFTHESIIREASGCHWKKDLRGLPLFTFVQLYGYLVQKTSKCSSLDISTCGYKKLKAFQFFKEGNIKDMQLCNKANLVYVKVEVLTSIKAMKYKVLIVFDQSTKHVVRAACRCPAYIKF